MLFLQNYNTYIVSRGLGHDATVNSVKNTSTLNNIIHNRPLGGRFLRTRIFVGHVRAVWTLIEKYFIDPSTRPSC